MNRRAKEYFEIGKAQSQTHEDQSLFDKEIEELKKVQKKLKEDFLASMEIKESIPIFNGHRIIVKENKNGMKEPENCSKNFSSKLFEDFFKPKFHEKYSYDFLKLKDIDSKPILHQQNDKLIIEDDNFDGQNRKVKFNLNSDIDYSSEQRKFTGRGILKNKESLSRERIQTNKESEKNDLLEIELKVAQNHQLEIAKGQLDDLD